MFGSLGGRGKVGQCAYCGCEIQGVTEYCDRCTLLLKGYKGANEYNSLQDFLAVSGFAFCPTCGSKSAEEVALMDNGNFAEVICTNCGQIHIINCNIDIMKSFVSLMNDK